MLIKSICSNVLFKAAILFVIFYMEDLSFEVSGVLKFSTMTVLLSVSHFMSINICFIYLGAPILFPKMFTRVTSFSWNELYTIM